MTSNNTPQAAPLSEQQIDEIEGRAAIRLVALTQWLDKYSPCSGQDAVENAEGVLQEDVPALLDEVRRLADLVREACMLRDFHRRQADHLAAKRDLAETVLAKWQAGDLKPEQALWMLQAAHAVGDVKTFDQLLAAAGPSV